MEIWIGNSLSFLTVVYFIFIFSFYKLVSLLVQSKKQEKNVSSGTSSKNESYYGSLYIIPYIYV